VPSILTICGSLRAGSYNAILLNAAEEQLRSLGATVTRWTRLRELPRYDEDDDHEGSTPAIVNDLRAAVSNSDGLIIATPAYNMSVPGGVKDVIDWCSRPFGKGSIMHRNIGLITASTGPTAGVAAAEYLMQILPMLRAHVVIPVTSIAKVTKALDEGGSPNEDTRNAISETVGAVMLAAHHPEYRNNEAEQRFELLLDGQLAGFAEYRRGDPGDPIVFPHTVTTADFRGRGVAAALIRHTLDAVRSEGGRIVPACSFVADFVTRHPQYADLVA
jgi:chromate reductase, NAD(P)H dehydrogenase (quinone)